MSRQEARAVLLEAFQRCGFKIPFFKFEPFYMGYHLFQHTDVVFGFGIMDRRRRHLYGRQGVMIQVSLLLQKKAPSFGMWLRSIRSEARRVNLKYGIVLNLVADRRIQVIPCIFTMRLIHQNLHFVSFIR